ncbi:hypothetical protein GCK72_013374 [Caenorhabditis remanei]|uniref:Major facilitator superfamily (MFS) profile domain-containing protein n=1 Tax=Caenorhabditis remanei TaxID=31234 RepID=A0A6A5GNM6_CAERE|nr:hypothetical protein GCK72_013374 [Caenorhabditis remanei]KAF1756920.1 hypothetical protein GCK72_013374 [Caenorhabditis remanei]
MVLYQITLVFSAQLLFVIFLDYMPPTYCTEDNFCYKMKSKCLTDYDHNAHNLCPVNMTGNRRDCIMDHKKLYFYSAQYQYQQDCTMPSGMQVVFNISAVTFIGVLLGNIILGILADKYGRRTVYFLSLLFGIPCLVLSALIKNVTSFYIFRLLTGIAISGTLTVGYTYAIEMISANRRLRIFAFANWPNARMIQVGLAYFTQEWARTTYTTASIACLALPVLWYLPESPIWLEQNHKYEEASRARKRIEKISGVTEDHHNSYEVVAFEKVTPKRVIMDPKLRTSFLMILFMYFYVGLAVYITDLNGADMTKNLYLGQFLAGLVLSIAQFIIGMTEPYLTGMGRRVLFLLSQLIAIICYILIVICLYLDWKGSFLYLTAYTLAYASQSICLEAAYLSLVELMPTDVRATVGSMANICMKIATILATQTQSLKYNYEPFLFFINLVVCTIGMILVFFCLEESREADMKMVGQTAVGKIFCYDEEVTPPGINAHDPSPPRDANTPEDPKMDKQLPLAIAEPVTAKPLVSKEQLRIIEKNNERNRPIVEKPKKVLEELAKIPDPVKKQLENEKASTDESLKTIEITKKSEESKENTLETKTGETKIVLPKSVKKPVEEPKDPMPESTDDWQPNSKNTKSGQKPLGKRPSLKNFSRYDNESEEE